MSSAVRAYSLAVQTRPGQRPSLGEWAVEGASEGGEVMEAAGCRRQAEMVRARV